jgi:hypothetical protein
MAENVSTIWYFNDWFRDTGNLSFEEKGLWMDLIGKTYQSAVVGVWCGAFVEIGEVEKVWPIIKRLGVKKVGDIAVCIDEKYVPLTSENYEVWKGWTPEIFSRLKIVCRKALKLEEQRKKNEKKNKRQKQHKTGINPGYIADISGINPGCIADESGMNPGYIADKPTPPRARVLQSPVSSNTPVVPPLAGGTKPRRGKDASRVGENTELMVRIGAWFKRRPETLWMTTEAEKLEGINPKAEEVELLEKYYLSDDPAIGRYRRHDLVTMLNNWNRELDWAREKLGGGRLDGDALPGAGRMADMAVV